MRTPPKRQQPRDQFTTYLNISGLDIPSGRQNSNTETLSQPWLRDRRLDQHFLHHEANITNPKEAFWVLYWHAFWKKTPRSIATDHLKAYLHEPAFWAANKFATTLEKTSITIFDCFQLCFTSESNSKAIEGTESLFEKVLRSFRPAINSNLRAYAQTILKNELATQLKTLYGIISKNDWSLLNDDNLAVKLPLEQAGIGEEEYRQIRQMLCCYRLYYDRNPPTLQDWERMSAAYNRLKETLWPAIEPEQLKAKLQFCADAVRTYYRGANQPLDDSIVDSRPNADKQIELEEESAEQQQYLGRIDSLRKELDTQLMDSFQNLPKKQQRILILKHGPQSLDRTEIAAQMGFGGDRAANKVSQALGRAKRNLAEPVIPWVVENLHFFTPTTLDKADEHQKLKDVLSNLRKNGVNTWLEEYFSNPS
ncbi:MAG: hypothetical protein AAGB19_19870 [Cyanobacteria bacterium P01_F01_bin.3]